MIRFWQQLEGIQLNGEYPLKRCLAASDEDAWYLGKLGDGCTVSIRLEGGDGAAAEARLVAWQRARALNHPNLARMLDAGRATAAGSSVIYAVSEFADDFLVNALHDRPLSTEEARDVLQAAVNALRYLHERSLVHTSVDAEHIMAVGPAIKLPVDTLQRASEHGLEPADDLWSLGMLLHQILTQRRPNFGRDQDYRCVDEPFATVLRNCLVTDPKKRWSIQQVATWLTPCVQSAAVAPRVDPLIRTVVPLITLAEVPTQPAAAPRPAQAALAGSVEMNVAIAPVEVTPPAVAQEGIPPAALAQAEVTPAAAREVPRESVVAPPPAIRPEPLHVQNPKGNVVPLSAFLLPPEKPPQGVNAPLPRTGKPQPLRDAAPPRFTMEAKTRAFPTKWVAIGGVAAALAAAGVFLYEPETRQPLQSAVEAKSSAPAPAVLYPQPSPLEPPVKASAASPGTQTERDSALARFQTEPPNASRSVDPPQLAARDAADKEETWRVVTSTYNSRVRAEEDVRKLNNKSPSWRAQLYAPNGDRGPFFVSLGGRMSRAEAQQLHEQARAAGIAQDAFTHNFRD